MKYIENIIVTNRIGIPIKLPITKNGITEVKPVNVNQLLQFIIGAYQPTEKLHLSMNELRLYIKLLDTIELNEDSSYIGIEDDRYNLLVKMFQEFGPLMVNREVIQVVPKLMDMINSATDLMPDIVKK
jgi:hypothetical protein